MRKLSRRVVLLFVRLLGGWGAYPCSTQCSSKRSARPTHFAYPSRSIGRTHPDHPRVASAQNASARCTHYPGGRSLVKRSCCQPPRHRSPPGLPLSQLQGHFSKGGKSYISMIRLARQLKRDRYDLAINLHRNFWWGAAVIYLASIPRRIGYAVSSSPPFLTQALPFHPRQHITISHLKATSAGLQALGSKPFPEPYSPERYPLSVAPTVDDQRWVDSLLDAHKIEATTSLVVIHPGTSVEVKQWRNEAWGRCATALKRDWREQSSVLFLLTGTHQERPLLEAIAQATSARTIILTSTTIGQLAALLARCRLVLGVDSGPMHLAVAQGTPTLQIFGPTDPQRYGAWGSSQRHAIVTSTYLCPGCPAIPCGRLHFQPAEMNSHPCVRLVSEQEVIAASLALLEGTEPTPRWDRSITHVNKTTRKERSQMELYHETSAWHHWLQRYWLLIPLGLIFVMAVAGFETYMLNASTDLPLQDVTDITLPGSPTRFDYQSLDPQARLLYIAHSGANAVIVFNIDSRTVVKNIARHQPCPRYPRRTRAQACLRHRLRR